MLVSDYIDALRVRLFDPPPGAGWTNAELIGYLNEAIRATCLVKADAYDVQTMITLVPGVVQQLPDDGLALFDITENAVSGKRLTLTDKSLLDDENRFWPGGTRERNVQHFAFDVRAPRRFYVSPPNDGTGQVLALYGALPVPLAALTEEMPLRDVYQPALSAFAISRAHGKPSKRADPAKASAAFNEFVALVGAKTAAVAAVAPRMSKVEGV
jgi:hypothetical protein